MCRSLLHKGGIMCTTLMHAAPHTSRTFSLRLSSSEASFDAACSALAAPGELARGAAAASAWAASTTQPLNAAVTTAMAPPALPLPVHAAAAQVLLSAPVVAASTTARVGSRSIFASAFVSFASAALDGARVDDKTSSASASAAARPCSCALHERA
eukprot:365428-Chlamydomonas_euryale.AAC.29